MPEHCRRDKRTTANRQNPGGGLFVYILWGKNSFYTFKWLFKKVKEEEREKKEEKEGEEEREEEDILCGPQSLKYLLFNSTEKLPADPFSPSWHCSYINYRPL